MERDLLYKEIVAFTESEIHLFDTGKYSGIFKAKSFLTNDDLKTVQSVDGKKLFFAKPEFVTVLAENKGWFKVEGNVMMTDKGIDTYYVKPGSAAPSKVTGWVNGEDIDIKLPYITPPRSVKIEIQTKNYVRRTDGTKGTKWYPLQRKFGPKDNNYLCVGVKGDPPTFEIKDNKVYKEEGTAIELQSENGGFIEFETPTWFQKWSELKLRIKEAEEMATELNRLVGEKMDIEVWDKESGKFIEFKSAHIVKFPFGIEHLRKGTFTQGQKKLSSKEYLEVAIVDKTWPAASIQFSEAIELKQFEDLHTQHLGTTKTREVNIKTTNILTKANISQLSSSSLINVKCFLQIIIYYITEGQGNPLSGFYIKEKDWGDDRSKEVDCKYKLKTDERNVGQWKEYAKAAFFLMCRTSFSSMFKYLLDRHEQDLFKYIVNNKLILLEFGYNDKTPFFRCGYKEDKGPTILKWLTSIINPIKGKDLLSYSEESSENGGFKGSQAMGKFDIKKRYGKWDKVRFEVRGLRRNVKYTDWVDFVEGHFKKALGRNSKVASDLIYDP